MKNNNFKALLILTALLSNAEMTLAAALPACDAHAAAACISEQIHVDAQPMSKQQIQKLFGQNFMCTLFSYFGMNPQNRAQAQALMQQTVPIVLTLTNNSNVSQTIMPAALTQKFNTSGIIDPADISQLFPNALKKTGALATTAYLATLIPVVLKRFSDPEIKKCPLYEKICGAIFYPFAIMDYHRSQLIDENPESLTDRAFLSIPLIPFCVGAFVTWQLWSASAQKKIIDAALNPQEAITLAPGEKITKLIFVKKQPANIVTK